MTRNSYSLGDGTVSLSYYNNSYGIDYRRSYHSAYHDVLYEHSFVGGDELRSYSNNYHHAGDKTFYVNAYAERLFLNTVSYSNYNYYGGSSYELQYNYAYGGYKSTYQAEHGQVLYLGGLYSYGYYGYSTSYYGPSSYYGSSGYGAYGYGYGTAG